ncbi:stalk domain-containing protein [Fictibacillus phosphorivorans]|uniref:stalk domain-containing protein n=1 Tax=Fictibacillus phosphorivorans TaxID=1221500 RepID=UPI00203B24FC|nr:CAP domain-containing protein [Fictibacillus phosphorivorans]MCM3718336.1 CAP domain-containing protein [Fictibacillus phosphorivorans]MCM3775960.1 CAP domain-containing protein [Fictibacillus phosphorivorans]
MKFIGSLLAATFLFLGFHSTEAAAKSFNVKVGNERVVFPDAQPIMKNNRLLVPIRPVFESMNADVKWNPDTNAVTSQLSKYGTTAKLALNTQSPFSEKQYSSKYYIQQSDVKPSVISNRTYIPLRLVGEAYGYNVVWNSSTNTATYKETGSLHLANPTYKTHTSTGSISKQNVYELETFFSVNKYRASNGKKELALNPTLSNVAREKSRDMLVNNYFDHTSPTYGSPFDMMKQFGISYTSAGENIAAGYTTTSAVMTGWMNSPGHKANILSDNFTEIGVGYIKGTTGYKTYWTQMFRRP